jgi:deoxyribodipyrimidine photo-lyase
MRVKKATSMSEAPALVWFQQDLRLADNPALEAVLERGGPLIPVYIWAPEEEGRWRPNAAAQWWLHRSLAALSAELEKRESRLIIRRGPTGAALDDLLAESRASAVFWNRRYEPAAVARDRKLKSQLGERGIDAVEFDGSLLFEPGTIRNGRGEPYRVFTAFWKACLIRSVVSPCKNSPGKLLPPRKWPRSLALSELKLEPAIDWTARLGESWQPGERGAKKRLMRFVKAALQDYSAGRDRPGVVGTSRLSPHLHFGEISPAEVWRTVQNAANDGAVSDPTACDAYLRQLGWREFAYHLLYHFPESAEQCLRPEFAAFPWMTDSKALRAWQRGKTGYPLVDAGMRELRQTGWMHNRVRMVVASFLVKHLLIGWQQGAAWFWETLVDADLANNSLGWQWVAGCGADAAPYFRIFNPVIQGEKFDAAGEYVRRWVPELARLPDRWIHKPWKAPASKLAEAGLRLGRDYPLPLIAHEEARKRALAALRSTRGR